LYGIIGEDSSDVDTLKVIVRRLANNTALPIVVKGYHGCAEMLRKGARQLRSFSDRGVTRFVICYDADRSSPRDRYREAESKIWIEAEIAGDCCIVIPVQELEAWILADLPSITRVIKGWAPLDLTCPPESVNDPKEYLQKLSRERERQRPRYVHAIHNEKVAHHLDLKKIAARCPSFVPLHDFVVP
jgi:hypothetical protein